MDPDGSSMEIIDPTNIFVELAKIHDQNLLFDKIIKYLTSTIAGSQCSIFLVNLNTNKLHMVASSCIDKKYFPKCCYEKGKGYTGWVFAQKKLLYIPNQDDHNYIHENYSPTPGHTWTKRGKCHETKDNPVGPFMAAPIKSGDLVIGVIRVPSEISIRKFYSKDQQDLLVTFADRLSGPIENSSLIKRQNKLIDAYEKIGQSDSISTLLTEIVEDIPEIVRCAGCSVFLVNETAQNNVHNPECKKEFILSATTSTNPVFTPLINKYQCIEGFTSWVAANKHEIKIDNLSDNEEIKSIQEEMEKKGLPKPIHHKGGPCEINDCGPFMAVPLIEENESIGVIRIIRHKDSIPFEDLDLKLLKAFAAQLSLTISNLKKNDTLKEIQHEKQVLLEEQFCVPLLEKLKNVEKITYSEEIKAFLDYPKKNTDLNSYILETLELLWKRHFGASYSFPPFEDFTIIEKYLLKLPGYRDHFIHQFQVFLLGSIIIDNIYRKASDPTLKEHSLKNFSDYYSSSLNLTGTNPKVLDLAWLITGTFHDLAYPIQKGDEIFSTIFKQFMGIEEKDELKEKRRNFVNLDPILSNKNYGLILDHLSDLHNYLKINNPNPWRFQNLPSIQLTLDNNYKSVFQTLLVEKRDHGVLGALMLLYQSEMGKLEYSTIIYPSALAISLHQKLLIDDLFKGEIVFERNPLAFLLVYCDLIQEWGRDNSMVPAKPYLEDISVVFNETDHKLHVKAMIHLAAKIDEKEKEAEKVFAKLKSRDIIFELKISNRLTPYESKMY